MNLKSPVLAEPTQKNRSISKRNVTQASTGSELWSYSCPITAFFFLVESMTVMKIITKIFVCFF